MAINNNLNTATTPIPSFFGGTGLITSGGPAKYVVSSVASEGGFTTIQSAINQAVSDGASSSSPAAVWILSGTYTENLTLQPWVNLACAIYGDVKIVGNAVYSGTGTTQLKNLIFTSNTTSPTISLQGATSSNFNAYECGFFGGSSGVSIFESTGAGANAFLDYCFIFGSVANTSKSLNVTNGKVSLFYCRLNPLATNTSYVSTISGGNVVFEYCECADFYSITGGQALVSFSYIDCSAVNASCFTIGASGYLKISNTILVCAATSGFMIDGTGLLGYQNITSDQTANKINTTLSITALYSTFGQIKFTPDTQGITGVTSGSNASASYVGEVISSVIVSGSAVSLTNNTPANVTSISLTAGDWDVWGNISFNANALANPNSLAGGITTTTSSIPATESLSSSSALVVSPSTGGVFNLTTAIPKLSLSPCIINVSSTTTVYLTTSCNFLAGTLSAYGKIIARRRR